MTIRELKKGELFTVKPIENPSESQVWVRGDYDRETRTYSATRYSDINSERFFAGSKPVYTDFTF